MKKVVAVFMTIIIIFSFCMISFAYDEIAVVVNGKPAWFDISPRIINDRAFVPARAMLSRIGAKVSWDSANSMIYATNGYTSAWYQVNNSYSTYMTNGISYMYDLKVAPCIINGKLFIPIRAIADIFGVDIRWDAYSRTVVVNTGYDSCVYTDDIHLYDFVPPQTIAKGQSYILRGQIGSATVPLNRVNIKIIDNASLNVEINETEFNINRSVYSLSDIDNRIRFGIISTGKKLMKITVVDQYEQRRVFSYEFEVKVPGGYTISSPGAMLWPVPSSGLITTVFWCDNVFCHSNGGRTYGHGAIDIAANENADVVSVQAGIVKECGFGDDSNGHNGYGNYIEVDHGNGIVTQYAHLYSIYVVPGQYVVAGQVIGGVGNTGNSTGNHLDFSIESYGQRCDPLYYLDIPAFAVCYEPCDKIYFDKALQSRGIIR